MNVLFIILSLMLVLQRVAAAVPGAPLKGKADESLVERGVQALEQGNYDQATSLLRQAVAANPRDHAAHYNLGLAYWNVRKTERALASFQEALRLNPDDWNSLYYLGRIRLLRGETLESITVLEKIVHRSQPPIADEQYQLGLAYLKAGRSQDALKILLEEAARSPGDANVQEALGRSYQALGRTEEADRSFAQAGKLKSEDLQASQLLQLCRQQLQEQNFERAKETSQQLTQLSSVEHLVELGVLLGKSGLLNAAIDPLRRAVTLKQSSFEAHFNLGFTLLNLSKDDEAEAQLLEAARIQPTSFEAYSLLGVVQGRLGKTLAAIGSFRHALEIQPDSYKVQSLLGLQYIEGSYYEEAIKMLSRAVQTHPREPNLRLMLIQAHHKNQDSVKALEQAQVTAKLFPALAQAHYQLGFQLASFGRFQEAKQAFQKTLELDAEYSDAHYSLGDILLKEGQVAEALVHFRKALSASPGLMEAHVGLGKGLLSMQKDQEVIQESEKALAVDPTEPQIHFNLAQAYRALGESEKSQSELQAFNRLNQERMKRKDREIPRKFPQQ